MTGLHHTANTLEQAYQVFFEALKLDDIDALVSAAWNYFNLPVLLTDENYKLIAQYPHRTIGEPIWDTLFTRKVLPRQIIERYQAEYLQGMERHYSPFYADSGLVAHCPRIFAEVYDGDQVFGHVAVFLFSEPLQDNDLPATAVFVDALKMLMVPRKNRTHQSLSTYLKDLLDPDTAPQIRALAQRGLEASLPGAFSVMVTPSGRTASQTAFAGMIVSQLSALYRSTVSAVYRGAIVTLFGMMSGTGGGYTQKEEAFFGRVVNHLAPAKSRSGLSPPFTDLAQLPGRYVQAYAAARTARAAYDFFDRLYPAPLFWLVSEQAGGSFFLHPLLHQLQELDQRHKTDYFRTLHVYCMTLRDKDESARQLCIHRNTLLYRLNRIRERFGIDLEDPEVLLKILNSFQLWEILQARGVQPDTPQPPV